MTAPGHAARLHDNPMHERKQAHGSSRELNTASSPHPPMAYSAGHQTVPDEPGSGKKFALYAAVTVLGLAAVVGVGIAVMPKPDAGSAWRSAFALRITQEQLRPLKIGAVSLGLKPEAIYALPTRPYFSRASDGRVTAEFAMDGGIYTVWFAPDPDGGRAQRIRFAKTFDDLSSEEVLKTQVSSFGQPAESECSRLLAHQGRKHCRYAWHRPDGSTANLSLRSIAPIMGPARTEMILSLGAPPRPASRAPHNGTVGTSL